MTDLIGRTHYLKIVMANFINSTAGINFKKILGREINITHLKPVYPFKMKLGSSFTSAIYYLCNIGELQSSYQSNRDEFNCSSYSIDLLT